MVVFILRKKLISSNPCYDMTVGSVLEQGNLVLAGLPSVFIPSDINDCATWINERFEDEEEGEEENEEGSLCPGESFSQLVKVIDQGSLDFQYTVHAEKTDGDDNFCNALNLEALLEGATQYSGNPLGFASSSIVYSTSTDEWEFIVSLPEGVYTEGSCSFTFIFSGWQTNFTLFGGFTDTENTEDIFVESGSSCSSCSVNVIYPNIWEVWYIVPPKLVFNGYGRYEILWKATSSLYDANELNIDIRFCKDSGADCSREIVNNAPNTGSYLWTIPYDSQYVTDEARIKIIATDPGGLTCEDMSDADFCPPMLTEQDVIEMMLSVHSASELMAGFDIENSNENSTSSEDSTEDEENNSGETIFELTEEEPIIDGTVNPVETVTPQQDGVEMVEDEDEDEDEEEDLFELNQETEPIEETEDPVDTTTPTEDGLEDIEELFELDQEVEPIEEIENPIDAVTSSEDGLE